MNNPNENTEAEIYANIRDKALEEAALDKIEEAAINMACPVGFVTYLRALKNAAPQGPIGENVATNLSSGLTPVESASLIEKMGGTFEDVFPDDKSASTDATYSHMITTSEPERCVVDAFPDTEADGAVFCGKCGAQK